jgi:hypothetical protein
MAVHLRSLSSIARWRVLRWVLAVLVIPLVLWACTGHPLLAPMPMPEKQNDQYYEVKTSRDIDILFVVDNSPSMSDKQRNLAKNFPVFMEELKQIQGGLPNVHIGVVSTDLGAGATLLRGGNCGRLGGDGGILQVKAGCPLEAGARFMVSLENGQTNNFRGDIAQAFSCIAALGDVGCGYEHPLQAARRALSGSETPENQGFLRPDAYLGIIFLTDEDDCSVATDSDLFADDASFAGTGTSFRCAQVGHLCDGKSPPVAPFATSLAGCTSNENGRLLKVTEIVTSIRALKPRPDDQIIVAAITGWTEDWSRSTYRYGLDGDANVDYLPLCMGRITGNATPAVRIKNFVEAFGANGSIHSICADDFSPAMHTIGEKLAQVVENPCIDVPLIDTSPDNGVQPDCAVIDHMPENDGFVDQAIRPCSGSVSPCWKLNPAAACQASGFQIEVDRGSSLPPPGTQQVIRCLTCSTPDDPRCKH